MSNTQINLGPGYAWANPRGADTNYQSLMRYMGNLTLAEFMYLVQAIEEYLPDGQEKDKFRQEFNLLKALPPKIVRRILLHPVWIYWVRSTRQIINAWKESAEINPQWRSHLQPEDPSPLQYLRESLALFSHLVLAAYMLAGKEIELTIKIRGGQYLSFPGTGLSYLLPSSLSTKNTAIYLPITVLSKGGNACSMILGAPEQTLDQVNFVIQDNRVQPADNSSNVAQHWLMVIDVTNGTFEVDNHDSRFLRNWVVQEVYAKETEVSPASDSEMPVWREQLVEAFGLLKECCPLLEEELSYMLRSIVPVSSHRADNSISCSSRDFWGAIQCSLDPGIAQADVLAHEYRHNILNAILEADPVIDESSSKEAIFYSPWRLDPRPLIGLIHGIYAFTEVTGFYHSYLERFGQQAPQADLAEKRIISHTYRLQLATQEFAKHAKLTSFGNEFFDGIQQRVDKFAQEASTLNPSLRDSLIKQIDQHRSE